MVLTNPSLICPIKLWQQKRTPSGQTRCNSANSRWFSDNASRGDSRVQLDEPKTYFIQSMANTFNESFLGNRLYKQKERNKYGCFRGDRYSSSKFNERKIRIDWINLPEFGEVAVLYINQQIWNTLSVGENLYCSSFQFEWALMWEENTK